MTVKKYCVIMLSSWFSKLFYNYHSPFLLSESGILAKKLSECLEPLSLSELWEPLCRTDRSNPRKPLQETLSKDNDTIFIEGKRFRDIVSRN